MSTKKLFEKGDSLGVFPGSPTVEKVARKVESLDNLEEKIIDQERFEPHVDYASASNFARYGSAKQYYKDAFERIVNRYPYDGSEAELQQFYNESNFADRHIFDEVYPRTNGYAILSADGWGTQAAENSGYGNPSSHEYIEFSGGPHTASEGMINKSLHQTFTGSNVYDETIYTTNGQRPDDDLFGTRESNLRLNFDHGVTVEFWLKKTEFLPSLTEREVIYDAWNNEPTSSDSYGRFRIELSGSDTGSPFRVALISGSDNSVYTGSYVALGDSSVTTASVGNGEWNHYAISVVNSGSMQAESETRDSGVTYRLYVNGHLNHTVTSGSAMTEITGGISAHIGALVTAVSGTSTAIGWGKLSASLDEFRYWKVKRTSEEIGRNWFTQVRGGTNTDLANTTLGVYYKFNEGITETSSIDKNVLDYSGRISNGNWVGYSSNSRTTASAMVESGIVESEYKDPIVYAVHHEVKNKKQQHMESGSIHDYQNNAALINIIPDWIRDERGGDGTLNNLVQIMGSYFDTLQLHIEAMPRLQSPEYLSSSYKPYPFASNLLENMGLVTPDLFVEADIVERIMNRNHEREFELELNDVKNMIYHNIYNNLVHIYKSKGTMESYRNLIRCFGVDEELVKVNLYANKQKYILKDRLRPSTIKKNIVNFNSPTRFSGTVYQYAETGNSNSVSFISGSGVTGSAYEDYLGMTVEAQVVFPYKPLPRHEYHFHTDFLTASLFGMHTANTSSTTDMTWAGPEDDGAGNMMDFANFQVYAIRDELESKHVHFVLTSSGEPYPLPTITSSYFQDVYDNERWNLMVSIGPAKASDMPSGSAGGNYTVTFRGISRDQRIEAPKVFSKTASMGYTSGSNFLRSAKRLYCGARRENFTGSNVLDPTDVWVSDLKYWAAVLTDSEFKRHADDPLNYGSAEVGLNAFATPQSLHGVEVHRPHRLALHWNFANITGSDENGKFTVADISSGSTSFQSRYGWLGKILFAQHTGRGDGFPTEDTNVAQQEYLYGTKQVLPETLYSDDMIHIRTDDESEAFGWDHEIISHHISFEKSMYQTISEEMLKMFAGITEYGRIIGEPVNKYRQDYKNLGLLRQIFFEKIKNTPDLDKYLDYYKWIDGALTVFLQQLTPASADVSENIRNMVESHILERPKYQTKFPTIEFLQDDPEGSIIGVPERLYNWRYGHAPIDTDRRADHCIWWKDRVERDKDIITSGDVNIDDQRERIREQVISHISSSKYSQTTVDGTVYSGSTYALRNFTKPYRFKVEESRNFHGGANYNRNKRRDIVHNAVYSHGPTSSLNVPLNVLLTFAKDLVLLPDCDDYPVTLGPPPLENRKRKYASKVYHGRHFTEDYYDNTKSHLSLPVNFYSSSVNPKSGYHKLIANGFSGAVDITNIHVDTYGNENDVPMQGPFTEKYVGGHQSRHIILNSGSDDQYSRPEAWRIALVKLSTIGSEKCDNPDPSGALGFIGADYGGPYPDPNRRRATYFREEVAKRPVNIRNIQTLTASVIGQRFSQTTGSTVVGNFRHTYDIVQSTGRTQNDFYFNDNGVNLPNRYQSASNPAHLPATTNPHTIIAARADANNRYGNAAALVQGGDMRETGPGNVGANTGSTITSLRFNYGTGDSDSDRTIFELPTRTTQKAIFVNRFSAPGGPEVMSRGFLNISSEEYSVYNSINFRNLSVRGSGSGENISGSTVRYIVTGAEGTSTPDGGGGMRMDSHLGTRDGLRTLLTRHCGWGGIDSGFDVQSDVYTDKPSFHKVFRNTQKVLKYNSSLNTDDIITASVYNNFWVDRYSAIPASVFQYSWITASIALDDNANRTGPPILNHPAADGIYSSSAGFESAIKWVSASHARSYLDAGTMTFGRDESQVGGRFLAAEGKDDMFTDFVGLNYHIVEPFTSSTNLVGYQNTGVAKVLPHIRNYFNVGNIGDLVGVTGSSPDNSFLNEYNDFGVVAGLNSLLLNRYGPYQHPSWKQIRVGESPVFRYHRRNNMITAIRTVGDTFTSTDEDGTITSTTERYGRIQVFDSGTMCVSQKYQPLEISLITSLYASDLDLGGGDDSGQSKQINLKTTYANNLAGYDNKRFNSQFGSIEVPAQFYDEMADLYLGGAGSTTFASIDYFSSLVYTETVYPSAKHTFYNRIRGRTDYQNTFWRDDSRYRTALGGKIPNAVGYEPKQSCWPLDVNTSFDSANNITTGSTGQGTGGDLDTFQAGELLNDYTHIHHVTASSADKRRTYITASALYALKHTIGASSSVVSPTGIHAGSLPEFGQTPEDNEPDDSTGIISTGVNWDGMIDLFRGDALWEAGSQAGYLDSTKQSEGGTGEILSPKGRKTFKRVARFVSKSSEPWYDTYDDYNLDLRMKFKEYSIVPEFRISEHMDFYMNVHDGNFLACNDDLFSIEGVPNENSKLPQNSSQSGFYTIFSNSDFMKHFSTVLNDHKSGLDMDPSLISLKCKAGIKFIPYDGLYPVHRTLQLAKQFSSSYGAYVTITGSESSNDGGQDHSGFRPFLTPFYAPGIMYNTIKSGIAVDWPVFLNPSKASYKQKVATSNYYGITLGDNPPEWGNEGLAADTSKNAYVWDYRIPFEAIIEPENYIKGIDLYDPFPHPSASIDATASWDGGGDELYSLMAHNFFAEVPSFFLSDGEITSLKSKPSNQLSLTLTSGSFYGARVKMRRSMNKVRNWSYDRIGDPDDPAGAINTFTQSYDLPQDPMSQPNLQETFTMYSRPSAFGPPVLGRSHSNAAAAQQAHHSGTMDSLNGYNWSFTPPYYHGEAWADLMFKVDETKEWTISEILEKIRTRTVYWRADAGHGDGALTSQYGVSDGPAFIPNNGGGSALYDGKNVNENAMQLSASVNLFSIKTMPGEQLDSFGRRTRQYNENLSEQWIIQPKFETPMLNFNNLGVHGISALSGTLTLPTNASSSISRGMWHQFGIMPDSGLEGKFNNKKGIFLEIGDIPTQWLQNHPTVSHDSFDRGNFYDPDTGAASQYFVYDSMRSLTDLLGFTDKSKRLGEIQQSKVVREAVVAVPFIAQNRMRKFFEIPREYIDAALVDGALAGQSIKDMVSKMKSYVMPPSMNFLLYDSITPFAMYIFEFEYEFDQNDLSYMWQNLAPRFTGDYKRFRTAEASISHPLLATELMGYANSQANGTISDKLQWMVFKIKQKANTYYFDTIATANSSIFNIAGPDTASPAETFGTDLGGLGNESLGVDYSYNWPYDFFSFVEMVKIDAQVGIGEIDAGGTTGPSGIEPGTRFYGTMATAFGQEEADRIARGGPLDMGPLFP